MAPMDPMMAPMDDRSEPQDPRVEGVSGGAAPVEVAGISGGPLDVVINGEDWLQVICPFLRARDGSWRSASPAREHRCWAMDPPAELPVLTQQRLCLVRAHDGCERLLHARELRAASLASARTGTVETPAVGVPSGVASVRRSTVAADAARGAAAGVLRWPRIVLAAIGVGVAAALVLAMVMVLGGSAPVATPVPTSIGLPQGSIDPSGGVDPSAGPDGVRRYRVREADTLRTIADRFGVSVRQLRLANDLGDPPRLEAGMIIVIPAS